MTSTITTLSNTEIHRYSRQLILPEIGIHGQILLKQASVLIVGVGGLGTPAALYLAAAGIGRLGLVDHDQVEITNLHRQILHSELTLGQDKVQSAKDSLERLNSSPVYETHTLRLCPNTAIELVSKYDIVLDCSDNPMTRYLLNDTCVLLEKPLVSGSALRMEGQLTVYNYNSGPCYRCIYPNAPQNVTNCSDGGVCGPITGCIGALQALEAVKIINRASEHVLSGKLLLMHGWLGSFKTVKLRSRQSTCIACGDTPLLDLKLMDYAHFCNSSKVLNKKPLLDPTHRISVHALAELIGQPDPEIGCASNPVPPSPYLVIDVRPKVQFDIVHMQNAINVPYCHKFMTNVNTILAPRSNLRKVVVICRRGNTSQLAVSELMQCVGDTLLSVVDVIGGLEAYRVHVDDRFPCY